MATKDLNDDQPLLKALQHPLRRAILKLYLERGRLSPRELSEITRKPLSNVSYHVRVLEEQGTLTLGDTRQVRGSLAHFYDPTSVVEKTPWIREALGL